MAVKSASYHERMQTTPITREARFEDYPEISALQRRYGLAPKKYDEWTHLWVNNPVYKHTGNWPIGWVLEDESRGIVGHIGNVPLSYELGARKMIATTSHALVVDEQYRAYSLPMLSHFFNQQGVDLFVDTTVNANAAKVHEMFRAKRVPAGSWDESSFWITEHHGFLAAAFAVRGLPALKPLAYPLSIALRLKRPSVRASAPRRNGVKIDMHEAFDEQFDYFWNQLRNSCQGLLLATRSRQVLDWHFQNALTQNRAWVVTATEGGSITAYAIFYREDKPASGLTRLRLVDFQALRGNNHLLALLLSWALEACRDQGIHMLEAIGFRPDKQRIIDELMPHKRKLSSWLYFYRTDHSDLARTLQNAQAWDPCCFDGDASL